MGFIDLSGSLGRHFGSIGVALDNIATKLSISYAEKLTVSGASPVRAEKCIKALCKALNVSDQLKIDIEEAIPEHVGLGSGTQMALAVGSALNAFYDLDLSTRKIAQLTDRGRRSGIGIGVFEQGGLVVDGGRGVDTKTPPVISHMDIPDSWRFLLVLDKRGRGCMVIKRLMPLKSSHPFQQKKPHDCVIY
jgi:beta-RFAP synthase